MKNDFLREFMSFGRTPKGFENPFADYSQFFIPSNWRDTLKLCQNLYQSFGLYRASLKKLYGYFLTDIRIYGNELPVEEVEEQKQYLKDQMFILQELRTALDDLSCYGIFFRLFYPSFQRFLASPWNLFDFDEVVGDPRYQFKVTGDLQLKGYDPIAKKECMFEIFDAPGGKQDPPMLIPLNPFDMEIYHDSEFTRKAKYRWIIPQRYTQKLKAGDPLTWRWVDQDVVAAIKKGHRRFEFDSTMVFAFAAPAVSGAELRGWGFPPILYHFRQIAHVQSYRRGNEAITQDRLMPIRILSPGTQSQHSGPEARLSGTYGQIDGATIVGWLDAVITQHRNDPNAYYAAPFPVEQSMLGADGSAMAAAQLLEGSEQSLISEIGLPIELYAGTMQLQSTPIAARLMEAVFQEIPNCCNRYLDWIYNHLVRTRGFQPGNVELVESRIADDIQKLALEFQLMLAGHMSVTSILDALKRDPDMERQLIERELVKSVKSQEDLQERLDRAGLAAAVRQGQPMTAGGQPVGGDPAAMGAAGGMPPGDPAAGGMAAPAGGLGPGMGPGMSKVDAAIQQFGGREDMRITELEPLAHELAVYLKGLPEGQKDSELRKLSNELPSIHAVTSKELEKLRNQERMQGGGAQGGGMPPGGMPMG